MTTVRLLPTSRWNPATINVPGHGSVSRKTPLGASPVEVTTDQAKYLLDRFLAKPYDPPAPPSGEAGETPDNEPTDSEAGEPPADEPTDDETSIPTVEVPPDDTLPPATSPPPIVEAPDHEPPPPAPTVETSPPPPPPSTEAPYRTPAPTAPDGETSPPPDETPYSPTPDGETLTNGETPDSEDSPWPLPGPMVGSSAPLDEVDEPTDQEGLVDFFQTATAEDIEAVKGIGQTTAQELMDERPLTWAKVDAILSQRQIDSAISHRK